MLDISRRERYLFKEPKEHGIKQANATSILRWKQTSSAEELAFNVLQQIL